MTETGKECEDCGYIGSLSDDYMCPECDENMLPVNLDEDPATKLRRTVG